MAEKFLYYLGAGASAQAMPTVKPIGNENSEFRNLGFVQTLRSFSGILSSHNANNNELQAFVATLSNQLKDLSEASANFATIDTYAKFLYLTDKVKFAALKSTLSSFFTLLQVWENKIDKRYLSWVTSILSDLHFPDNVKVLTWNYDYQVQLAAETFRKETFVIQGGISEHSPPVIPYWPAVNWEGNPKAIPDEISLLHLNGLAGSYFDKKHNTFNNVFLNKDSVSRNSNVYPLRAYGPSVVFSFAWEKGGYQEWLIEFAQKMIHNTTILVVIGYSFPFFNRDVDKKIFEELKSSGKLRKIYFQDPNLDGKFLTAQFDLNPNVEIIHRKEVDSFYIPFEL